MTTSNLETRPSALRELGIAGRRDASARGDGGIVATLSASGAAWDGITYVTCWLDGVTDTTDGDTFSIAWLKLGSQMAAYATAVVAKGEGTWFTPAISTNGRCRDADIAQITQLSFDCDGAGDWHVGLERLDRAGLAYIGSRSSSHRVDHPKFHLHLPLAQYWHGEKAEWRQIYRFSVGWFSEVFDLSQALTVLPPKFGFDHAPDRLGQPWFLAARRTDDAPCPEVRTRWGHALDLEQLLSNCGFAPRFRPETRSDRPRRVSPVVLPRTSAAPSDALGLLELAFANAGWLGPRRPNGARAVRCPWSDFHTTGFPLDGSTVIFPPRSAGGVGAFTCLHSHCRDRTTRDVLLALPGRALQQAILKAGGAS